MLEELSDDVETATNALLGPIAVGALAVEGWSETNVSAEVVTDDDFIVGPSLAVPPRHHYSRTRFCVWYIATVGAVGGFVMGWGLSSVTGTFVYHDFQQYFGWDVLPSRQSAGIMSIVVSFTLGAAVGSLLSPSLTHPFGRLLALRFWSVTALVGSGIMGFTSWNSLIMLCCGRLVFGLAVGGISTVMPVYVAELAPTEAKGAVITLWQMGISAALVVTAGCEVVLVEYELGWRVALAGGGGAALTLFLMLFTVPESPRWLISHGRIHEAQRVLNATRDSYCVMDEIAACLDDSSPSSIRDGLQSIFRRTNRKCYRSWIAILFPVFQQTTGINLILTFAPPVFERAIPTTNLSLYGDLIMNLIGFVSVLFCFVCVDKYGRKVLLLYGGILMALVLGQASVLVLCKKERQEVALMWVLSLCIFFCAFAWSWGPIMWIYAVELFPASQRIYGAVLTSTVHWLLAGVVQTISITSFNKEQLSGIFFFCAVLTTFGVVFFKRVLPETSGVSLERSEHLFRHHNVNLKSTRVGRHRSLSIGVVNFVTTSMSSRCCSTY
ncbi:MAG: hypothetical protein KVP17_002431 [Porospora cf. gigantea B]|uniref:uncharacterized protein n=1 Tax=Porospora cf. gigantea B TaxID=2853592 RepID=UPI003571EC4A|nr:MAG: hypothetical protein KVP17_002431 [Porospora cf. gigantea B]